MCCFGSDETRCETNTDRIIIIKRLLLIGVALQEAIKKQIIAG
ncbi:MAG: hypothetical protein JWR23_1722 [Mucilaginibacter sp.]|nr:hypothetical protein [Mucilaginibacter sp.]